MKSSFRIITKEYVSNCLIEAIKAKLSDPHNVKLYYCKPRITKHTFQEFHIMWTDGEYDYDFSDIGDTPLPFYKTLLYKGVIRRFTLGFAKRYSYQRNHKSSK